MIADKYIELIHREIDGRNSPPESAKLKTFFADNPEAQQLYDDLLATSSLLQEVKPVEPPAHLQHVIMNMLPQQRVAQPNPGLLQILREWFATKFNFNYAYVFAGGLTFGIVMYALLLQTTLQPPDDLSKLSGTMVQREQVENLKTAQTLEINREGVTGKINLKNAADLVVAELALDSPQLIELTISFDEKHLGFKSYTMLDESASSEAILIPGAAQLTHVGQKHYAVVLTKKDHTASPLELKIVRAGEVLYEQTVRIE